MKARAPILLLLPILCWISSCDLQSQSEQTSPAPQEGPPAEPPAPPKTVEVTGPAAPVESPAAIAPPAAGDAAAKNEPAPKTIAGYAPVVHPLGFRFQRPESWTMQETAYGIRLVPPDAVSDASGPCELYTVSASPVPKEIDKPDDPRIQQYLDTLVRGLLPFLRPTGAPQPIETEGGTGAVHAWAGQDPTGRDIRGKIYGILQNHYCLGIMAVAEASLLERREKTLRTILSTCAVGTPKVDPRMLGVWYSKSYASSGPVGERLHASFTQTLVLLPDGTLHATGETLLTGQWKRYPSENIYDSMAEVVKGFPDHGRWGGERDRLYIMWDDGATAAYRLYVQGNAGRREALLTAPDGKKQLWTEYNE
ncbi:MAG: hypothetical protein JXP34_06130 [Planctomycetes bacterium]|nr:hypothetical protein [Planctomycetota bacterium]